MRWDWPARMLTAPHAAGLHIECPGLAEGFVELGGNSNGENAVLYTALRDQTVS